LEVVALFSKFILSSNEKSKKTPTRSAIQSRRASHSFNNHAPPNAVQGQNPHFFTLISRHSCKKAYRIHNMSMQTHSSKRQYPCYDYQSRRRARDRRAP